MDTSFGINTSQQLEQASIHSDLNSLDSIRKMALKDQEGALKRAAKEFEAFFLNMMLKSMRQASAVIGDDSPMNSPQEKMYTSMLDEQMSVDLSQKGLLGIADLMTLQLSQNIRSDKNKSSSSLNALPQQPSIKSPIANNSVISSPANESLSNKSSVTNSPVISSSFINPSVSNLTVSNPAVNNSTFNNNALNNNAQSNIKNVQGHSNNHQSNVEMQLKARNDIEKTKTATNLEPEKKSLFENAKAFVEKLLPYAKKAASIIGVDPKLLIAQAAQG